MKILPIVLQVAGMAATAVGSYVSWGLGAGLLIGGGLTLVTGALLEAERRRDTRQAG